MSKPSATKGMDTVGPVKKDEPDYEAENAHRTLTEAHGIMNNEELMPRVRKIAGAKSKAAADINDMLAAKKAAPMQGIDTLVDVKKARDALRKKGRESV